MKIIEIAPRLSSGGAERFTVDLCNELSKSNDVTLIVLDSSGESSFYLSEISSRVNVILMARKRKVDFSMLFSLRKVILEIKPDVVHTHLRAIVFSLWTILTTRGIQYFHTVHSDAQKEAKGFIFASMRKWLFKKRLVTPVTISIESNCSFNEYYKLPATMIFNGRDVPPNVDISEEVKEEFKIYRKDSNTKVLVCLARLSPVKRHEMLAKIVDRLNHENNKFTLLMIGNHTNYPQITAKVESYGCDNIYILGERHNPLEYLAMADAYCLCSSYEGMPISLIEAMGVGAIPVCTPVGGIVDVIESGVNGFLSTDLSEGSYYNTLKMFLELEEDRLCEMKDRVKKSYTPFSMKECAQKYINLFVSKSYESK